jgi:hypothetical protein
MAKNIMTEVYEYYRNAPLKDWEKMTPEELGKVGYKNFSENCGEEIKKGNNKGMATICLIAAKVARQTDEKAFSKFIESGEVPAIKLNQTELEFLKGGQATLAGLNGSFALGAVAGGAVASKINKKFIGVGAFVGGAYGVLMYAFKQASTNVFDNKNGKVLGMKGVGDK